MSLLVAGSLVAAYVQAAYMRRSCMSVRPGSYLIAPQRCTQHGWRAEECTVHATRTGSRYISHILCCTAQVATEIFLRAVATALSFRTYALSFRTYGPVP